MYHKGHYDTSFNFGVMLGKLIPSSNKSLARAGLEFLPPTISRAGRKASIRFVEFFTANIHNKNTRLAYAHAVTEFFPMV